MTRHELVLLTSEFPFGAVGETFLETEITTLADRFRRIHILPSARPAGLRRLPGNAELVEMSWLAEPSGAARRRALATRDAAWVGRRTARARPEVTALVRAPSYYADVLARNVLKARSLAGFIRDHRLHDAIFYDYWFENSTLALALVRRAGTIGTAVCRAHGFDVYDARWAAGAVPFREAKAAGLDAVFAVSDDGRRYLEQRSAALRGKVHVQHLGVADPERIPPGKSDAVPLILTCGRLIPSKQTHLVPEVLGRLGRPVRWVHLGDGPERERVLAAAAPWAGQVSSDLRGHIENRAIADFYCSEHVDLLLSLSTSEGLPVTMMEAQSFGVPVVARAVNGVPEIVNPTTGILVSADAGIPDLAAAVSAALEPERFSPAEIRAFFTANFDAQSNYGAFADAIIALHESSPPAA